MKRSWLVVFLFAVLAAPAAAVDTDCPGGSSPCPYQSATDISQPATASPLGPTDVAIAPNGDLYVADRSANRVKHYGADGALVRAIGERGPNLAQFEAPTGVAFDGAGDLRVLEINNNRFAQFSAAGEALATVSPGQGSADGQVTLPQAFDVGPDGHLWVADTNNNRVVELLADGTFVRKFGGTSSGTLPGQFSLPLGITVTPAGDVWVADTFNNRVQRLPAGTSTWEVAGMPGQFSQPTDVEFAADALYVAELNRMQKFAGGTWSVFGTGGGKGLGAGAGKVAVADQAGRTVRVFNAADGTPVPLANPIQPPPAELRTPQAVAFDGASSVYVADTAAQRVVKLNASTGALQLVIGAGQLAGPWGVDFADGQLYVADTGNNLIRQYAPDGTLVTSYGGPGNAAGQFSAPVGVSVDADGRIYVTETGNDRVQRSNAARDAWDVLGTAGSAAGQFSNPGDVAVAGGDVWVADTGNSRVQKLPSGSSTWSAFGTSGSGDGQFFSPRGISVSSAGVFVADTNNARVQRLNAGTGAFEAKWGGRSFAFERLCEGEFNDAWGIAADSTGAYVTDQLSGRLKRFRFSGQPSRVVCDQTPPTVSPQTPANGATVASTPTFTVAGGTDFSDSPAVRVRILQTSGIFTRVVRAIDSTTQSNGIWTIPGGTALPAGTYLWEATQRDAPAGNRTVSARRSFTVSSAPASAQLAVTALNTGVPVSGAAPGANPVIDDDTPTFGGTAENEAGDSTDVTVRLERFDGSAFQTFRDVTVQRSGAGDWSATLDAPVPPDTYRVRASQVTDTGQKVTANWFLQVTALTVAQLNDGVPVVGLSPGANPVLDDSTPTFAGRALVRPGDAETVTVHLDRFNGSGFVDDVHTFTTGRNANGLWSATAPALVDETWRVRVTQSTQGGTRESRPWFFQLITPKPPAVVPPAITFLDDGVAVSGTAPGANPLFMKSDPLIKGTASTAAGSSPTVQVHYDRNSATGFVPDVHVLTVPRDATTGAWQARQVLINETWRVRVTQGDQGSPGWFFQVKVPAVTPPPASFPLPVTNSGNTTRRVTMPDIVGKSVFVARGSLDRAVPNVDISTIFSNECGNKLALDVLAQAPPAGATLTTSEGAVQPVVLNVCDGGRKFLSECSQKAIGQDLKQLPKKGETGLSTELLLRLADCNVDVDVKTTKSKAPSTTAFDAVKYRTGKAAIETTLKCSRTDNDFAVGVAEVKQAIGNIGDTQFGLAKVSGGWKLPSHPRGAKSAVELQVINRGSDLPPAEVYVDADAVQPRGAYLQPGQVFLTDGGGHARLQFVATKPGKVRVCVVQRVGETGVATWAGELEVVDVRTGDVWETIMGRRLQVTEQGGGRVVNPRLASASIYEGLVGFMIALFQGRSDAVEAAGLGDGGFFSQLAKMFQTAQVSAMQVTLDGKLIAEPKPPPTALGPCLTGVGAVAARTTCPTSVAIGGHALLGGSATGTPLSAAGAAGVIIKDGRLIGNDGSTLIGNDGSTLIGNDGSTLIGNDGSTLVGNDGSTLVGNDGSTLVGNDGASLVGNDGSTRSTRAAGAGSRSIPVPNGNFTVALGANAISIARAPMEAGGAAGVVGKDGSRLVAEGELK